MKIFSKAIVVILLVFFSVYCNNKDTETFYGIKVTNDFGKLYVLFMILSLYGKVPTSCPSSTSLEFNTPVSGTGYSGSGTYYKIYGIEKGNKIKLSNTSNGDKQNGFEDVLADLYLCNSLNTIDYGQPLEVLCDNDKTYIDTKPQEIRTCTITSESTSDVVIIRVKTGLSEYGNYILEVIQ